MRPTLSTVLLALGVLAAPTLILAQNTTKSAPDGHEQLSNQEQKTPIRPRMERLRQEDGGSRVDELRVGGQTQRISVQPKVGDMPAYEILPANEAIGGAVGIGSTFDRSAGKAGQRVWNVFKF